MLENSCFEDEGSIFAGSCVRFSVISLVDDVTFDNGVCYNGKECDLERELYTSIVRNVPMEAS